MVLQVKIMGNDIQFKLKDTIIEIDRHPFFTNVDEVVYVGGGNIHFKYRGEVELVHLPSLLFGEYPLYIRSKYRVLGEKLSDADLKTSIESIDRLEVCLDVE